MYYRHTPQLTAYNEVALHSVLRAPDQESIGQEADEFGARLYCFNRLDSRFF